MSVPIHIPWALITGTFWGKNEDECTRKVEISLRKKSLAVGQACAAILWPKNKITNKTYTHPPTLYFHFSNIFFSPNLLHPQ